MLTIYCVTSSLALGQNEQWSITQAWAKAIDTVDYSDLPLQVIERVKWNTLDALGVMIHNAGLEDLKPYLERVQETVSGAEALVWGTDIRTSVENAAAANAFLLHGAENDDNDYRGNIKTTAISVPPALALAEWREATGKDLITAMAIAYTLNGRLGAMGGEMMHFLGAMPTSFFGSAGTAAAAAYLLELDKEGTTAALGMALGSAGGAFQYFYDQTEEKKILVARAVRNGVESAILAQKGYSGASAILEGEAGIFHSPILALKQQIEDPDLAQKIQAGFRLLTQDLYRWEGPLFTVPKFYSCSSSISPFLMALEAYRKEHPLHPENIVHFEISRDWYKASPFAEKVDRFVPPRTVMGAQLNMNYTIALYLLKGSAQLSDFTAMTLQDTEILQLAAKGSYVELPDLSARLVIHLKEGPSITLPVTISKGEVPEPLYREQRIAKFKRLTSGRLSEAQQEQVIRLVHDLDEAENVRVWVKSVNEIVQPSNR